jgi:adenylate kinase
MVQLSTGDMLREAQDQRAPRWAASVAEVMDRGELVTDEIVIGLIEEKIAGRGGGFIFDGFPRTLKQADALGDAAGPHRADPGCGDRDAGG